MQDKEEYKQLVDKIEQGCDVNQLGKGMCSLLHRAASVDDIDIARLLINKHADVNIKDRRHETPLHYAATYDSYSVAKLLIENCADVNAPNKYNTMPIHSAAESNSLSAIELLINNGADVNARNGENNTPLHRSVSQSQFSIIRNRDIIPVINGLISHGADVNAHGYKGDTPLHIAATFGFEEAVDILLRAGAVEDIWNAYSEKPEDSVFSLGTLHLGATLKNVINDEVEAHLQTLLRKRKQLIQTDDYGIVDRTKWDDELEYFVLHVLVPALDLSNTYIKWVLINIDESSDNYISAMTNLVEAVEEVVEETSYDIDGYSYSDDMDPIEYENMCAEILDENGWNTRITSASGDQGVDVFAEKDGESVVLQCKRYSTPVGNKAVQEAHAGKGFMGTTTAAVVTNSSYTQSAKQLAASLGVLLLHHDELGNLSCKLQSLNTQ